jgi:hypothetical protein
VKLLTRKVNGTAEVKSLSKTKAKERCLMSRNMFECNEGPIFRILITTPLQILQPGAF